MAAWTAKAAADGGFEFSGVQMQQHVNALAVMPDIVLSTFPEGPVAFLELGTAAGAFAVYLRLVFPSRVTVTTYGIHTVSPRIAWLIEGLGIHFRVQDIFEDPGRNLLESDIAREEPVVLFCDNGNKVDEVRSFAPFLKPGDLLMCHDYKLCRSDPGPWAWSEITYPEISDFLEREKFAGHMSEEAAKAGIGCFRKWGT